MPLCVVPNSGSAPELDKPVREIWSDVARQNSAAVRHSSAKGVQRPVAPPQPSYHNASEFGRYMKTTYAATKQAVNDVNKNLQAGQARKKQADAAGAKDLKNIGTQKQKSELAREKVMNAPPAKASGGGSKALDHASAVAWHQKNDQVRTMSDQLWLMKLGGKANSPVAAVLAQRIQQLSLERDQISAKKPARPSDMSPYKKQPIQVSHVIHTVLHHSNPVRRARK